MKAGILEEMLEDTLDIEEDEELEEEADAEVDKVLFDLTDGKLGLAGSVDTELPVSLVALRFPHPRFIILTDCRDYRRRRDRTNGKVS